MPKKLQGAVIVGYLIGYDPTATHVKMQKSPAIVVARIVYGNLKDVLYSMLGHDF